LAGYIQVNTRLASGYGMADGVTQGVPYQEKSRHSGRHHGGVKQHRGGVT
jgi:hypothetical protein